MNALVLTMVLGQVCFTPSDSQPGWKSVEIPFETPDLAAPDGIEQYRPGEQYEIVDEHPKIFLQGEKHGPGRTTFRLHPGSGACDFEVQFAKPLRGANVEVSAWGPRGAMTLRAKDRVGGTLVRTSWGKDGVSVVDIVVHDHFRDAPVLERWRAVCRDGSPVRESASGRWLEYFQPLGAPVTLCNRPHASMRVNGDSLRAVRHVTPVTLARQ